MAYRCYYITAASRELSLFLARSAITDIVISIGGLSLAGRGSSASSARSIASSGGGN